MADSATLEIMDRAQFEDYVVEAVGLIPQHIRRAIENVAFVVEAGQPNGRLLGLYRGIPLSGRHQYSYSGVLPDVITIYQSPIEAQAGRDPEAVRRLVHDVVHHEIGHYFGLSEAEVRQWERRRVKRQKHLRRASAKEINMWATKEKPLGFWPSGR